MKKILVIAFSILLLFSSCRPQNDLSRDWEEPETWAELFDVYWAKMSTNYLFWSLDCNEGHDWDSVYAEYRPRFEEIGAVLDQARTEAEQLESFKKGCALLTEISSALSDGHHGLIVTDGTNRFLFNNANYRPLKEFYPDITAMEYVSLAMKETSESDYPLYKELIDENIATIMEQSFGLSSTESGRMAPASALASRYGFNSDFMVWNDVSRNFHALLGRSDDGIVYLGFNSFSFSGYRESDTASLVAYLDAIGANVADCSGIILDLRGNSGGRKSDLGLLWSNFLSSDEEGIYVLDTRRKESENRTDYTPWTQYVLQNFMYGSGHRFDKSVPIVLLVNRRSMSCAEYSMMFFMALRDYYGYDVTIIGSNSRGAQGILVRDDSYTGSGTLSEDEYNGGISEINPYITMLYTPYLQTRYRNGVIYEGTGIPADYNVDIGLSPGYDKRLETALGFLRSRISR